jgi:hypothetical protein
MSENSPSSADLLTLNDLQNLKNDLKSHLSETYKRPKKLVIDCENTLAIDLSEMEHRLQKSISSWTVTVVLWTVGSHIFTLIALIALAKFTTLLGPN